MLAELMQHWGTEGLDTHLMSLQTAYKRRAQLMHNSAKQVPARLSAVTAAGAGLAVLLLWELSQQCCCHRKTGLSVWFEAGGSELDF